MGQLFAKVFASIYDSSIAEDWEARVVFQDLLILADDEGCVDATPESIARRTNLPIGMVREALPKLEAPDPSSRTPDHEGRRILRLDEHRQWGWRIVNFVKYRESASKAMLQMAEADRKKAYRAKFKRGPSPDPNPSKLKSESENSPGHVRDMSGTGDIEPPAGFPKSEGEARTIAAFIGCTEDFAATEYHKVVSRGYRDSQGVLVKNFHSYLKISQTYANNRTNGTNGHRGGHDRNAGQIKPVGDVGATARSKGKVR